MKRGHESGVCILFFLFFLYLVVWIIGITRKLAINDSHHTPIQTQPPPTFLLEIANDLDELLGKSKT